MYLTQFQPRSTGMERDRLAYLFDFTGIVELGRDGMGFQPSAASVRQLPNISRTPSLQKSLGHQIIARPSDFVLPSKFARFHGLIVSGVSAGEKIPQ